MQDSNISKIEKSPQNEFSPYLQFSNEFKESEHIVYYSAAFPSIFYAKRTMRSLLDDRNQICHFLGLSSRGKSKRQSLTQSLKNNLINQLIILFGECPSEMNSFSFSIIEELPALYVFFASEDRYVPLCKDCNRTIYISLRNNRGRIVCANNLCKRKLLTEFQFKEQKNLQNHMNQHLSPTFFQIKKEAQTIPSKKIISDEEKDAIKKAARKISQ